MDEGRGARQNTENRGNRYIRVFTHGKLLTDIEGDILRAISGGARVLIRTANGPNAIDSGLATGSVAITEWADALSREHGLDWNRVGSDVLFTAVR